MRALGFRILAATVLLGCLAGGASANSFTLAGSDQYTVAGAYSQGQLFATSQVTVGAGGSVVYLYSYNESTVTIEGGAVLNFFAYQESTADISGGTVSTFHAYDAVTGTISGGSTTSLFTHDGASIEITGPVINATGYDESTLTMTGLATNVTADGNSTVTVAGMATNVLATATGDLTIEGGLTESGVSRMASTVAITSGRIGSFGAYGTSIVDVTGGTTTSLCTYETSSLTISDGAATSLCSYDTSIAAISGGLVSDLAAFDTSTVAISGRNFVLGAGLALVGSDLVGTGILSGEWLDGTPWDMTISGNDLTASIWLIDDPVVPDFLAGDADEDGDVDMDDYAIVKANMGTEGGAVWTDGDFDGNGDVDFDDLLLLHGNYGKTIVVVAGAAAIPEPATLSLTALAALALLRRKRK